MSFKKPSQETSMSCSCSQVVSHVTLLAANGFLTRSNVEKSTSSKYKGNSLCKAPKWLMKSFLLVSVSLLGHLPQVGNMSNMLCSLFLFNNYNFLHEPINFTILSQSIMLRTFDCFIQTT